MTVLLWPLVVLLLAMPESSVSGDATCRPPPREFLNDTNLYVCPPAVSGRVMYDRLQGFYTKYAGAISYGVYDSRYYSAHGYVSVDLSGFPDSANCLSARLLYYQYAHDDISGGHYLPNTSVVLIPDVNVQPEQLFLDIGHGAVVDAERNTPDGWVARRFNSVGVAAVDSCIRSDDTIDIGIYGGSTAYGAAYGAGSYDPLRAYLEVRYSTSASYCDVVALDAAFDSFPLAVGDSVVVVGRFTNTGNQTAYALPLIASCTGTTSDTVIIDSLAPDDTIDVRTALPPAVAPGTASLVLCSDVQGDWCRHNDTAAATTYVFPHGTRSVECFELDGTPSFPPSGWRVCNGGDTNTWHRGGPADRYAHSGDFYATCERTDATDDWLITCGLSPNSSTADTVGVFFSTPYSWCYPQVWALGSQDPYDALGLLLDTVIKTQGWVEKHIGLDQFDGQAVYVGFRIYSSNGGPLCLDDVWFTSERAAAVEEPTKGPTPGLRLSIGQNPVTGNSVVMRYQTPKAGPLLVEVINASGRVVARQRLEMALGGGQVVFRTGGWPSGAYFFRVKAGGSSATAKCAVQRRRG